MGILRSLLTGRSSKFGLVSDLVLVGTAAARFAQQRSGGGPAKGSTTDLILAGGAAIRLLQRLVGRRRSKRLVV